MAPKADPYWRRARLAARIILRGREGRLTPRDRRLAAWLVQQPGVTSRLIDQGIKSIQGERKQRDVSTQ